MNRILKTASLFLMAGLLLTGCASTNATNATVAGDWSKPVNGLRMMAKPIQPHQASDEKDVRVLIFVQNVSDKTIDYPGLTPEPMVYDLSHGFGDFPAKIPSANLRVIAELAQPTSLSPRSKFEPSKKLSELIMKAHSIKPGEIQIHALWLDASDPNQLHKARDRKSDEILTHRMHFPGLSDSQANGPWRLRLVYRPSGFVTEGEKRALRVIAPWENVEIQLPAVEITAP